MATDDDPREVFAVNFAALAREVAMDILPLSDILELHQLTLEDWERIQAQPKFQQMLTGLIQEWNSASNVRERVKVKAATGLEMQLEVYIHDIADPDIPLAQRTEAGKFLARLGELDGKEFLGGPGGGAFQINLNIGTVEKKVDIRQIEGQATRGVLPPE